MSKIGLMDKGSDQLDARSSVAGTDRLALYTSTGTEPELATVDEVMESATGLLDNNNAFTGDNTFAGTSGFNGVSTFTNPIVIDTNTGITAFATGGQGSAVALTGEYNNVTTVASAFDSVKLLTAVLGQIQTVKNSGVSILSVFPNTSDSLNALAVNLSVDIPVGGEVTFRAISDTVWETQESLYVSSPTTQTGGLLVRASDNASNVIVALTNESHGQATTVSLPDAGAAATKLVQSTAAVTLAEADTLTGLTATTAEINRLDDSEETEEVTSAGAISVVKTNTNLDSGAGTFAATLAACPATMVGKIKTIRMSADNGDVTVALTEVQGGTAASTATFDAVTEELILIGSAGGKWTVVKEFGVTLS